MGFGVVLGRGIIELVFEEGGLRVGKVCGEVFKVCVVLFYEVWLYLIFCVVFFYDVVLFLGCKVGYVVLLFIVVFGEGNFLGARCVVFFLFFK